MKNTTKITYAIRIDKARIGSLILIQRKHDYFIEKLKGIRLPDCFDKDLAAIKNMGLL